MEPLISVIIPAYNPGELIRETIDSVLSQTYPKLELIVIDDGSTDNTSKIISEYKDPRIKYRYQVNCGLPAGARNAGARISSGEYLAFIDHDDIWMPEKLEKQMDVIKRDPAIGLVSTNAYIMEGDKRTKDPMIKGLGSGYLKDTTFFPSNKVIQSTAMIKKDVYDELGGLREDPELKAIEDYDLWLRIYQKYRCYYMSEFLAYYRKSTGSTSGNRVEIIMRDLDHFNAYFASYGFSKKVNEARYFYILLALAGAQFAEGDKHWRSTMTSALKALSGPKKMMNCAMVMLPYQFARLIYYFKRGLKSILGQ